ncbi:MAG: hypothetical protein CMN30_16165 [Sandaracinus sp.]|nr:hypothetical protein [Sandaracinus sp.]
MGAAVLTALVAAALGAALGLSRRGSVLLGATHTLAVVVALVVIGLELVPTALAAVGLWALVVFGGAYAAASLLERVGHAQGLEPGWGVELGFLALCAHRVGDGLAMAHFGHAAGGFEGMLAIAAHGVPVIALVTIAYRERSRRAAVVRVILLAIASLAGIALHEVIPEEHAALPWISAALAGLLLHVVTHGWNTPSPESLTHRLVDVGAVVAGLAVALVSGHDHGHEDGRVRDATLHALLELGLDTAPVLLVGLVAAAALKAAGWLIPRRWLGGGSRPTQALRGAVLGLPAPICACGVLPLAHSLRSRGAAPALVVAFLFATPVLALETFALSVRFLGWPFALVRFGGAVAVAVLAALLLAATGPRSALPPKEPPSFGEQDLVKRFVTQLDELTHHVLPWTLIGLVAAAYVEAVIPPEAFAGPGFALNALLLTLVAVPSYVCATSATPLAAVLVMKGVAPGAVLVGLLLGPAINLATAGWLWQTYGRRAALAALGALVLGVWALAGAVELGDLPLATHAAATEHDHGAFAVVGAALLGLLAFRSIWRVGLRAWLGALGESLGSVDDHGHDNAHGHGHAGHGPGHSGHGHSAHGDETSSPPAGPVRPSNDLDP